MGVIYEYFNRLFGQLYAHGGYMDSVVSCIQFVAATEAKLEKLDLVNNLLLPLPSIPTPVHIDQTRESNVLNSFCTVNPPVVSLG